jgi:hypothetical protein
VSVFAVFTRSGRMMHAVAVADESRTVCGLPTGRGSGLVRDGRYGHGPVCSRCWPRAEAPAGVDQLLGEADYR